MGMSWDWSLVVGFVIDKDDLEKPFKREITLKTRLEDRYDPRTGKKIGSIMVIDREAGEEFFYGKSFGDDFRELIEELEAVATCSIVLHGDYCNGEDMIYAVEPKGKKGDELTLKQVADLADECERIRKFFKKRFGIELGEAVVTSVGDYS